MAKKQKRAMTPSEKRAHDMKEEILDHLEELRELGYTALTKTDKEFIKARRTYLTGDQRDEFAPCLKGLDKKVEDK